MNSQDTTIDKGDTNENYLPVKFNKLLSAGGSILGDQYFLDYEQALGKKNRFIAARMAAQIRRVGFSTTDTIGTTIDGNPVIKYDYVKTGSKVSKFQLVLAHRKYHQNKRQTGLLNYDIGLSYFLYDDWHPQRTQFRLQNFGLHLSLGHMWLIKEKFTVGTKISSVSYIVHLGSNSPYQYTRYYRFYIQLHLGYRLE